MPVDDQGLRQAGIVIGKSFLEPYPVLCFDRRQDATSTCRPADVRMRVAGTSPRSGGAIGVQPKQREAPRRAASERSSAVGSASANRAAAHRRRDRADVVARALAQGPKRPPVTVFRAGVLQPTAIEAHEVAKPPRVRIPGMLDEGGQPSRQDLGQALLTGMR